MNNNNNNNDNNLFEKNYAHNTIYENLFLFSYFVLRKMFRLKL